MSYTHTSLKNTSKCFKKICKFIDYNQNIEKVNECTTYFSISFLLILHICNINRSQQTTCILLSISYNIFFHLMFLVINIKKYHYHRF